MEEVPFVSIVIPTLGKTKYLKGVVKTAAKLDYGLENFEIIIIWDYETNRIKRCIEIAKRENVNIRTIYKDVPAGHKRNIGVEKAKGEIIAFTDDDTLLREDWLNNAVKCIEKDTEFVGVGGPNFTPEEELPFAKAVGRIFGSKFLFSFRYTIKRNKAVEIDHNPTCNYIIKKRVFEDVRFDEKLWPGEDVEFDIRLKKRGYKILYSPDVVVWHHRRSRPIEFLKQMFNYGTTRAMVTRMHPNSFHLRYYLFLFASIIMFGMYAIPLSEQIGVEFFKNQIVFGRTIQSLVPITIPLGITILYFCILGLAGLLIGKQTKSIKQALYAPIVMFIQHFGYSIGLIYGHLKRT